MRLQEKLTRLCADREWNQSDLARKLGTSPSTVQNWLSGRNRPTQRWLPSLSRLFGVPVDYLVDDAQAAPPPPPEGLGEAEAMAVELVRIHRLTKDDVVRLLSSPPELDSDDPGRAVRHRRYPGPEPSPSEPHTLEQDNR